MASAIARSLGGTALPLAIAFASQEFSRAGRALESGLYATPATDASCWLWLVVIDQQRDACETTMMRAR